MTVTAPLGDQEWAFCHFSSSYSYRIQLGGECVPEALALSNYFCILVKFSSALKPSLGYSCTVHSIKSVAWICIVYVCWSGSLWCWTHRSERVCVPCRSSDGIFLRLPDWDHGFMGNSVCPHLRGESSGPLHLPGLRRGPPGRHRLCQGPLPQHSHLTESWVLGQAQNQHPQTRSWTVGNKRHMTVLSSQNMRAHWVLWSAMECYWTAFNIPQALVQNLKLLC